MEWWRHRTKHDATNKYFLKLILNKIRMFIYKLHKKESISRNYRSILSYVIYQNQKSYENNHHSKNTLKCLNKCFQGWWWLFFTSWILHGYFMQS